jgi:hypothetical protein
MKKIFTLFYYLIFIILIICSLLLKIFKYKLIIVTGSYGDIFCFFSILDTYLKKEKNILLIYPSNHKKNLDIFFKKKIF